MRDLADALLCIAVIALIGLTIAAAAIRYAYPVEAPLEIDATPPAPPAQQPDPPEQVVCVRLLPPLDRHGRISQT